MLGLLAHGLHLALLVAGLAGVAALLLPQLREAHTSRSFVFHPPTTVNEHERRVAVLRRAALAGQLGTAPASAAHRHLLARSRRDSSPWRAVAVSSSAAAAFVHAAMVPHHLDAGVLVATFFCACAAAQAAWAYGAARSVNNRLLVLGMLGNLALIALWAATRTVGLPWGLAGTEDVGAWDVSSVVWEWSVVIASSAGLYAGRAGRELPLGRLGRPALLWLTLSTLTLAVLSLSAGHG